MERVADPPVPLDLAVEVWPSGTEIVRVHALARSPSAFNASPGLARFRPVTDTAGTVIDLDELAPQVPTDVEDTADEDAADEDAAEVVEADVEASTDEDAQAAAKA